MATVFLALDLALDRKVAIKVLDPQLGASAENVERFRREAKVAASLNHPNIIGIYAVGDDPELAYFVMKYIEGRSLDSVVRETGPQPVTFVRGVVAAAGRALHYAHSRGVVHRDVKPANFMLDTDGWLIVTDFGIAKRDDAHGLTLTGSIIGTPYYMAPEQFTGAPITAAADQYALGVVAFELLTGKQPFNGATIGEVMRGHLLDPIPAVSVLRPDVPAHIEAAITRMLAKEPKDRFPSLEAAVEAFGTVSSTLEQEVRTQIVHLAQSGAMRQPQLAVPVSPAPAVRPRPDAGAKPSAEHLMVTERITHTPPIAPSAPVPHRRRTMILIALGLLVGVVGATALLRPDLVNRYRKQLLGPTGDAADTASIVRSQTGQFAPEDVEGMENLSPEALDAMQRQAAQALRDSIARAETQRVADSVARADSIKKAAAATGAAAASGFTRPAVTRPALTRRQAIRDSLAALAAQRNNAQQADAPVADARTTPPTDTAVPASQPPQSIPSTFVYGTIVVGNRCPGAVLYTGDSELNVIGRRGVQEIQQVAGPVTLRIRTRTAVIWDTTFTVTAGVRHVIGARPLRCPQ
jgi:serine/threonine-protein kinase